MTSWLELVAAPTEDDMKSDRDEARAAPKVPATAATGELLGELFKQSAELVKKEIALAHAEMRADLAREVKAAEGLGAAAVCGLCGLNLLFLAAVLALAQVLPGWVAALIVAGVVLAAGGLVARLGWAQRVVHPLERTRKTLKEDVQWAKERLT